MLKKIAGNIWERIGGLLGFGLLAGVFSLVFLMARRAIFDLDIWLHLKTGEVILSSQAIPRFDIFSFTFYGKHWVDHEWLFQVITYLIYSAWQAEGLILFECGLLIASFLVLFIIGYSKIKRILEPAAFVLIIAYASNSRFNIRPELFSLFFFSLYLYSLVCAPAGRMIWLLVAVQALWVNIHGYFFLGPLLFLVFIAAEYLKKPASPGRLSDEAFLRLKRVFFCLILASFLNPQGIEGVLYPAQILKDIILGRTRIFFSHISELAPTWGRGNFYKGFYGMAALSFIFMALNFRKVKITEVILFAFFFVFAFSVRNIMFFLFIAYIIIISYLEPSINMAIGKRKFLRHSGPSAYHLANCFAMAALILWAWMRAGSIINSTEYDFNTNKFTNNLSGFSEDRYPKEAVDFILANNIKVNILNDFNSGAYLIGRAYPLRKVFIDGRTEFYGQEFFKEYAAASKGDVRAFKRIAEKYRIGGVLLTSTIASTLEIAAYLYKSPEWSLVFLDHKSVVFLRDLPGNKTLIARYKLDLKKYKVPKADILNLGLRSAYPEPYINRARFFELIGEDDLAILEAKEALRVMPGSFDASIIIGRAYLDKKMYSQALESFRPAVLRAPSDPKTLAYYGICYKELKQYLPATAIFKGILKINKRYTPAYYHLGDIYLSMGNEREAALYLTEGIKYNPKEPKLRIKLAEAYYSLAVKHKDASYIDKAKQELEIAKKANLKEDSGIAKDIQGKLKQINNYLSAG